MKRPKDVDSYIAASPEGARAKLVQIRKLIKSAAPKAEERISYGMPYYGYHGRLAYFRLAKSHIGLYIPPPVIAMHRKELAGYGTATATIRFPIDKTLPVALIKKLVRARAKLNDTKGKKSPIR
ncbi:MAG: DUF1801 domain-containing protein [Candidatus Micrarchaeota archaeon]